MTTIDTQTTRPSLLEVFPFTHPQGCRTYLVADPASRQAMVIDPHLDLVDKVSEAVESGGWSLILAVDTHTHADHPSGSADLAKRFGATRVGHEAGKHVGVTRHPADGDRLHLGDQVVTVDHAPGHTPDHIVLATDSALFSGDTLLIGAVARTDFLGGDAGQLFDSIHRMIDGLKDEVVVYPGHDYQGRVSTTVGAERENNPWLKITDRDQFITALTANAPARPTNMDDLLRLNREGMEIPTSISAKEAVEQLDDGGTERVIDVRTGAEFESQHIAGSHVIPLDQLRDRADEVRATPAPRLLLCRSGARAVMAQKLLSELGVSALTVVNGGIEAYAAAGGETVKGREVMSLERQVRIAAGALILLGTVLGAAVNPWFYLLAGFIGAGLVFSGVTDTCGMGMVISRMPWNQARPSTTSTAGGGCAAGAPPAGCAAGDPNN